MMGIQLRKQGRVDDAIALLQHHADAGNLFISGRLLDMLEDLGRTAELNEEAAAGTQGAVERFSCTPGFGSI
jgi:hypothetical protein